MGPMGRHRSLAPPLVSQSTKFPSGNSARRQRAYVLLPNPPRRELLIVYGNHIVKFLHEQGFELLQTQLHPSQESIPSQRPWSGVRLPTKLHLIPTCCRV
eukprot:9318148-Ditylum_brightwellii.AAC.1